MKKLIILCAAVMLLTLNASLIAGTTVSWSFQRGGDLYNGGSGTLEYGSLYSGLLSNGHTVLPGITVLNAANLSGVDMFFSGTNSHVLTASEATAINAFVQDGGCVILETNSDPGEQVAANSVLAALGITASFSGASGNQGPTAGTFSNNSTWATVGPLGDLRNLTFGVSLSAILTYAGGTLVGTNGGNTIVEFQPFGSSGGRVLAIGDPLGFNLFNDPLSSYYNANDLNMYLNFFENQVGQVIPAPAAILLGGIGVAIVGWIKRKRMI